LVEVNEKDKSTSIELCHDVRGPSSSGLLYILMIKVMGV
jgi:hypothetical protein